MFLADINSFLDKIDKFEILSFGMISMRKI